MFSLKKRKALGESSQGFRDGRVGLGVAGQEPPLGNGLGIFSILGNLTERKRSKGNLCFMLGHGLAFAKCLLIIMIRADAKPFRANCPRSKFHN